MCNIYILLELRASLSLAWLSPVSFEKKYYLFLFSLHVFRLRVSDLSIGRLMCVCVLLLAMWPFPSNFNVNARRSIRARNKFWRFQYLTHSESIKKNAVSELFSNAAHDFHFFIPHPDFDSISHWISFTLINYLFIYLLIVQLFIFSNDFFSFTLI